MDMVVPFQGDQADALDQRRIIEPAIASSTTEAGTVGDIAVGIDVDDVGRIVGGQPHIDPSVVAQLQRFKSLAGGANHAGTN